MINFPAMSALQALVYVGFLMGVTGAVFALTVGGGLIFSAIRFGPDSDDPLWRFFLSGLGFSLIGAVLVLLFWR